MVNKDSAKGDLPKDVDKKDISGWEYRKREILSASPLRLIIMLYEEAIRSLEESKKYIGSYKTYDNFNKKLFKAMDIIKELRLSLDMKQGEIAENLDALYEYLSNILYKTGSDKKTEPIDESIRILEELLSAWRQIEENPSTNLKNLDSIKQNLPRLDSGFSIKG